MHMENEQCQFTKDFKIAKKYAEQFYLKVMLSKRVPNVGKYLGYFSYSICHSK